MSYAATAEEVHDDHKPTGWRRWILSTNHKDIGTMYIIFGAFGAFFGSTLSLLIRMQLAQPHGTLLSGGEFQISIVITARPSMIFFFVMPVLIGVWKWFCPLVGAPDGLPRLNNFVARLRPALILLTSVVVGSGAGTGWTFYPPLVVGHRCSR